MIESKDEIVKAERNRLVLLHRVATAAQSIEFPAKFVRNSPYHAALKRRQRGVRYERETVEQIAQGFLRRGLQRHPVPGRAMADRGKNAERLQPDEGISPKLR